MKIPLDVERAVFIDVSIYSENLVKAPDHSHITATCRHTQFPPDCILTVDVTVVVAPVVS